MNLEQQQAYFWYLKGIRDANVRTVLSITLDEFIAQYKTEFPFYTPHPSYPILQYFKYDHLPKHLQRISQPIGDMAMMFAQELPNNDETNELLRKLLEAKDCAVRSALALPRERQPTPSSDPSI